MKKVFHNLATAAVLALSLVGTSQQAFAVSPGAVIAKLNWDGFHTCKAQGDSGWTAVARGISHDSGEGGRYFQVRNCFDTQAECNHFLNRIHHTISTIEELRYAGCTPRG